MNDAVTVMNCACSCLVSEGRKGVEGEVMNGIRVSFWCLCGVGE